MAKSRKRDFTGPENGSVPSHVLRSEINDLADDQVIPDDAVRLFAETYRTLQTDGMVPFADAQRVRNAIAQVRAQFPAIIPMSAADDNRLIERKRHN